MLRRGRNPDRLPGTVGVARLDRRTKNLTKRLRPGDVAVIDHVDIDRVSADALVGCKVAAVVNAAPSVSGRYPNLGPEILLAAGIPGARFVPLPSRNHLVLDSEPAWPIILGELGEFLGWPK